MCQETKGRRRRNELVDDMRNMIVLITVPVATKGDMSLDDSRV